MSMTGNPSDGLALRVTETVEYDVLAEKGGRYLQVRDKLGTLEDAREEIAWVAPSNPSLRYLVVKRTTTVREEIVDEL